MDITEYAKRLIKMNWKYQDLQNAAAWNEGRKEFERMVALSWTSPEYRKVWNDCKKRKLGGNE